MIGVLVYLHHVVTGFGYDRWRESRLLAVVRVQAYRAMSVKYIIIVEIC